MLVKCPECGKMTSDCEETCLYCQKPLRIAQGAKQRNTQSKSTNWYQPAQIQDPEPSSPKQGKSDKSKKRDKIITIIVGVLLLG